MAHYTKLADLNKDIKALRTLKKQAYTLLKATPKEDKKDRKELRTNIKFCRDGMRALKAFKGLVKAELGKHATDATRKDCLTMDIKDLIKARVPKIAKATRVKKTAKLKK